MQTWDSSGAETDYLDPRYLNGQSVQNWKKISLPTAEGKEHSLERTSR